MISREDGLKIAEAAKTWIGTPHINAHKNKGVGIDCARLPEACVEEAGFVPEGFAGIRDNYTCDWFLSSGPNIMLPFFDKWCIEIELGNIQEGDFLLYQIGRQISHCAIYIGEGKVIHSIPSMGVCEADMDTDFHLFDKKGRSRLRKIYRFGGK